MQVQREPSSSGPTEILYGRQVLLEVLRAGRRSVSRLLIAAGLEPSPALRQLLRQARAVGVPIESRPRSELDRRTASAHHQGVVMEVSPFGYTDFEELLDSSLRAPEPPFLLVLDHVHDPQNVGSMMRSAEVAGVHGVILARDNACGITPAVVRASSGAVEYLNVARVANIADTVRRLQQHGIQCLALEALPDARPLASCRLTGGVALVVGNEGEGVRPRVRKTCDEVVRLPVCGRIGSLNAAVAAAVAMFEVRRQRDAGRPTTP